MSVTICGVEYSINITTCLDLSCNDLTEVPPDVFKLVNLRRLELDDKSGKCRR